MCSTTTTGAAMDAGRPATSVRSAWTPPAEAPTTTIPVGRTPDRASLDIVPQLTGADVARARQTSRSPVGSEVEIMMRFLAA
jgi:hypothetical protein